MRSMEQLVRDVLGNHAIDILKLTQALEEAQDKIASLELQIVKDTPKPESV